MSAPPPAIRAVVADDHQVVRSGFAAGRDSRLTARGPQLPAVTRWP
jgi:hypothetical protein